MSSADSTHSGGTGSSYRTLSKVLVTLLSAGLLFMFGVFGIMMLNEMMHMPIPKAATEKPAAAVAVPAGAPAPAPAPGTPAPAGEAAPASASPTPAPASGSVASLGATLYMNCLACHGDKGQGPPLVSVPPMAPPLAKSAYVNGPTERLAMILLNGVQPEGRYTGIMMSMKPIMDDEKMAAVLTYVRSNFGNNAPPITADQIKVARLKYESRQGFFLRSELDKVTADLP